MVTGGKDAGSADFVVQSSGLNIALWEGLILKDKAYTKTHILKCYEYLKDINRYYMVVYILGKRNDFTKMYNKYMNHILDIEYPDDFYIDKAHGYKDITSDFEDVGHLKIAKTILTNKKEMFHVVINLGK